MSLREKGCDLYNGQNISIAYVILNKPLILHFAGNKIACPQSFSTMCPLNCTKVVGNFHLTTKPHVVYGNYMLVLFCWWPYFFLIQSAATWSGVKKSFVVFS